MRVFDIVPLTNIPRPNPVVFTYYYPEDITRFSVVTVPVGNKQVPGLVIKQHDVQQMKQFLRKSTTFALKEIVNVLQPTPVVFEWQFVFAQWIADYYWASLGSVLKKFIPDYLLEKRRPSYQLGIEPAGAQRLFLFPDMSFFDRVDIPLDAWRVSSLLTKKKEFTLFSQLAAGVSGDIYGTRRVLFAPFNRLKEIHIFEEIDSNHKSWEQRPRVHAVHLATQLAAIHHVSITYHSTLPSLESYIKKRPFISLEKKEYSLAPQLINVTKEALHSPFSEAVRQVLTKAYTQQKKVIMYVNRRGEGRFILCRDCGFVPHCPNCDLSLTLHNWVKGKPGRTLVCHHCGYQELPPSRCAQCDSYEIRSYGFGSERVEQEVRSLLKGVVVYRLDSDRAPSERLKQQVMQHFFDNGNVLVATSMLFAVSPHPVDTVIVTSPDSELNIPDFAQNEKLFFNLWRLRSWAKGAYYIQTYNPLHPALEAVASGNWKGFYREELLVRKSLNYPPFSSIIKLTCLNRYEHKAQAEAQVIAQTIRQAARSLDAANVVLLGPAPAFLPRLKGRYRYNMLIKVINNPAQVKQSLLRVIPSSWEIDVDPIDSL